MKASGNFDAFAVTTRTGPHVTLQAGVVHMGRHWAVTARRSVKVSSIGRLGWASATIKTGLGWRVVGGGAVALDLAHPSTLARDPVAGALAGGALLRLGLGQVDQLRGYAEVGVSVPASFQPVGRVVLATRISHELIIEGDKVIDARGCWALPAADLALSGRRARRWRPNRILEGIPDVVANLAYQGGTAWLGVEGACGAVALPAEWDSTDGWVRVSRKALSAVGAALPGRVCVTLDESSSRRPDAKVGLMLRGDGRVVDLDGTWVSIAVTVDRVSYWSGFASRTKLAG